MSMFCLNQAKLFKCLKNIRKDDIMNEEIMKEESMQYHDYKEEIIKLIKDNLPPKALKNALSEYHENDMAQALEALTKEERYKLYNIIDIDTLANIFEYLDDISQYISELPIKKRITILEKIELPIALEYLRTLPKDERSSLIELMNDEVKAELLLASTFDEDEIGSRMSTNYINIPINITVKQAMKELVAQAAENDNISTIYVTDEDGVFMGAIDLKDLIIARNDNSLESIIKSSYPYVYTNELIDNCIEDLKDYSEDSIPVLDQNNILKGVLSASDLAQLIDDEMSEDYARLAGLSSEEDLNEPLKQSIVKRLPWLIVLLGLGLIVSSVVGIFEHVVEHLSLIICFQSLVLDMAGNVGTQSLAITIRVLMDEQIEFKQKIKLILKEAKVGLCNGLLLGMLSFIFIGLYLYFFKQQTILMSFSISFCTGAALLIAMLLSSISGTCIPMIFKKLNIDPAIASGPLITTINDLVAVISYYGLAWILLINILSI